MLLASANTDSRVAGLDPLAPLTPTLLITETLDLEMQQNVIHRVWEGCSIGEVVKGNPRWYDLDRSGRVECCARVFQLGICFDG